MKYFVAFLVLCFFAGLISWKKKTNLRALLLVAACLFVLVAYYFQNSF